MADTDWVQSVRRDIGRLADQRPLPKPRRSTVPDIDGVFLGWRYESNPVLGALAWDIEQFDLAMRRAAYAAQNRIVIDRYDLFTTRLPRREGLQLRGTAPGSLELLLDIPMWIVVALASQPATALVNLIALLSAKESVRVRLRQLVLTKEESELLAVHSRAPARLPPPSADPKMDPDPYAASAAIGPPELERRRASEVTVARQGDVPDSLSDRLEAVGPLVDVELGGVRVRTTRPEVNVVVKQGSDVTSVEISGPRR